MMTHWEAWHGAYADPTSSLSRRLRIVQDHVRRFLDETAPLPVRHGDWLLLIARTGERSGG